jgi:hypothetical protein
MQKKHLVDQLTQTQLNFNIGLSALALLNGQGAIDLLKRSRMSFKGKTFDFVETAELFSDAKQAEIMTNEFAKMLFRATIRELFEIIKKHCITGEIPIKVKEQSFYQFGRIIRNAFSHNMAFTFKKYDKSILPVVWRGKSITSDMENTILSFDFFGYQDAFNLLGDFEEFVFNSIDCSGAFSPQKGQ